MSQRARWSMSNRFTASCNDIVRADRVRWDQRYRERQPGTAFRPDALLSEHRALLDGRGRALDVAAGTADNALFLASLGFDAYAVDISIEGLRIGSRTAQQGGLGLSAIVADLDQYPLPDAWFSVIVVIRYLNRDLFARLVRALVPDGLLFYKTFNTNREREHPGFNARYLLQPGELVQSFPGFRTIATNDGSHIEADTTYWIGVKLPE